MENQSGNGILEEFRIEFLDCWHRLPNKAFFLILLAAWLALFQFLGNSTLGYVRTSSLFLYMLDAYTGGGGLLPGNEETVGLIAPVVVLVVFWLKRKDLLAVQFDSWSPALLLILMGLVFHVGGYMVQQPRISVVGMFTGLFGLTGLAWGRAWMRASFFPYFLLAFCVPLGSFALSVTFRLRLLVCWMVEWVSRHLLTIDVLREGTILKDPTNRYEYEVAAACSGMRSLAVTVALAAVLGFFSCKRWWKRAVIIAAAFPLAVLGNLLRMLAIVIAAKLGGKEWGDFVHEGGPLGIFSLLPYIPAFVGLLYLEHVLRDPVAGPVDLAMEEASA